jgi:type I restriction enzyme S subunit
VATYTDCQYWPLNTTLYITDFKGNDPRFVYYVLDSIDFRAFNSGGAIPSLNRNYLGSINAPDIPLLAQRKIAGILSAYDDLIENNTRRIKLLEEMAQRIYREWFVAFHYPGHEKVSHVDSELGPIPEGWRFEELGGLARIDKGLSYQGAYLTDDGLPMANLKCFDVGGGFRRDGTKPYSGPFKERHAVSPGTLIVANTDLTQAGNVIGSPAIVPRSGFSGGGLITHHLFAIRPHGEGPGRGFLYHTLRDTRFRAFARGRASGTTVLGLRTSDCEQYRVLLPPSQLRERFSLLTETMLAQAESLEDANLRLRITRNLLLPRLISGQIDVTDLDIAMPHVAL